MLRVDMNADLGESFGAYTIGADETLMRLVTSANIACGFHAGDPSVMERTVALAAEAGTAVGAHPGYPDLQGFGRRHVGMTLGEIRAMLIYQIGALRGFCAARSVPLRHVKLHGALYNEAAVDRDLARTVCQAVRDVAPEVSVFCLSGSVMLSEAERAGLRAASEVFADRAYNDDGTLVSRKTPGSVLHDAEAVARRVVGMVRDGAVESVNGNRVPLRADSICVHGDNAAAVELARRVREALEAEGVAVKAFGAE